MYRRWRQGTHKGSTPRSAGPLIRTSGVSHCPQPGCTKNDLVIPIRWQETSNEHWRMLLWCPNCLHEWDTVCTHRDAEAFDAHLQRGERQLERDLAAITAAGMEDSAIRFVYALQHDHIVPSDF